MQVALINQLKIVSALDELTADYLIVVVDLIYVNPIVKMARGESDLPLPFNQYR